MLRILYVMVVMVSWLVHGDKFRVKILVTRLVLIGQLAF